MSFNVPLHAQCQELVPQCYGLIHIWFLHSLHGLSGFRRRNLDSRQRNCSVYASRQTTKALVRDKMILFCFSSMSLTTRECEQTHYCGILQHQFWRLWFRRVSGYPLVMVWPAHNNRGIRSCICPRYQNRSTDYIHYISKWKHIHVFISQYSRRAEFHLCLQYVIWTMITILF